MQSDTCLFGCLQEELSDTEMTNFWQFWNGWSCHYGKSPILINKLNFGLGNEELEKQKSAQEHVLSCNSAISNNNSDHLKVCRSHANTT